VEQGRLSVHAAADLAEAVPDKIEQAAIAGKGKAAVRAAVGKAGKKAAVLEVPSLCKECEIRDATGKDTLCDRCRESPETVVPLSSTTADGCETWIADKLLSLWQAYSVSFFGVDWEDFAWSVRDFVNNGEPKQARGKRGGK
jgi:hypothetical protein